MSSVTIDINGILNQVTESQAARQRKADDDFHRLSHEIANGKNPTAERVEKVLIAVGKSVDDLRLLVQEHLQRQADASTVQRAASLASQRQALEKEIERNDANRDAALRKWDENNVALAGKLNQIAADERAADQARNRLIASAAPELATEYRNVLDQKRELQNRIGRMRVDIGRRDDAIPQRKAQLAAQTGGRHHSASELATNDEIEQWKREVSEWTAMADAAEKNLPEAEKALADLQSREASIVERMLQP